jgi:hypothetical protein
VKASLNGDDKSDKGDADKARKLAAKSDTKAAKSPAAGLNAKPEPIDEAGAKTFTGTWKTAWGPVTLEPLGDKRL